MLLDLFISAASQAPAGLAVNDGVRTLTHRQMVRLADVLRSCITQRTSCERVGVMLPASAAFPAAFFGVLWAGRIAVPLNFLLNSDELAAVVADSGIDVILTIRHFETLVAKTPARPIFLEDLSLKRRMLFSMIRKRSAAPACKPEQTAVVLYTSGTTSTPKGVELTQENLHSNAMDSIRALEVDSKHVFLNLLPPFHVFGLTGGVIIPLALHVPVIALPRFSPVAVPRLVAKHRVSLLMAIPSMYAAILRTKSANAESFRSVRLAISGGEPLPDNVRQEFAARFGVALRQGYGLTETSPVISVASARIDRPGTVGKPIPRVQVEIVGNNGDALPVGAEGEILVRGPGVMKGYFRKPQETRKVIDSQGRFHTGDLGRFDADGFLTITGRIKDMLIIGGENVFAREIESALEAHESVLQAAVIGEPDELRGEIPVAFIIPKPGFQPDETVLRQFVKNYLAGFKVPRRILIRSELPTGPTGKILKRMLRDSLKPP